MPQKTIFAQQIIPSDSHDPHQDWGYSIFLGKFHHDRTLFSRTLGIMVREIIPIAGRKIQVTLWLLNIAMENDPFIDYFRIKTSIYLRDFPWLC